ncbi:dienelactone hydrolase family protein [Hoyosella subflava]|uniref:Dienelactone hydrolase domain-containing protein n=1 Tax=Hoyosella subflava (strain DSM 45089 / JCM 17490 / NBRC 109087 / DQS3-9A1) TaxID=443218 RepID=F6EKE9_HOYSD|nr:dienelactone hydrolase family protein [Hoyosella subflava]AEF39120.1 hypothetical protein AS9A_0666 [Hoyosella subflava DQS3-9A1]
MTDIQFAAPAGPMQGHLFLPSQADGATPYPGVVVVHDAIGMTDDTLESCQRIADKGYVVLAPDLYSRGGKARCVPLVMKDLLLHRGRTVDDLLAAREHLVERADCTGAVGIIGFCMGGGFAILMAPKGFDASAPFYGVLPRHLTEALEGSCPMVASFGGRDPLLIGGEKKLVRALEKNGVEHDVKTYPKVGHSFANKIDLGPATPLLRVTGFAYNDAATEDAWHRVFAFFGEHLKV